jgi:hypothetical protein
VPAEASFLRNKTAVLGAAIKGFCIIHKNEMYSYLRLLEFLNLLSPELNPICYLLALFAHDFLHVSRIRVKSLTLRLLMSYTYIYIYTRADRKVRFPKCWGYRERF